VAELRDALEARGLDTKGTKPFLVERLTEALAAEAGNGAIEGSEAAAPMTEEEEVPMEQESPAQQDAESVDPEEVPVLKQ
jgi:hypothetical protein